MTHWIIISLLVIIVIVLFVFVLKSISDIGHLKTAIIELKRHSAEFNRENIREYNSHIRQNDQMICEIFSLKEKLRSLENSVLWLREDKSKVNSWTDSASNNTDLMDVAEVTSRLAQETDTVNIYYFSTPDQNGNFNIKSSKPEFKEGASIYKFWSSDNDLFEFCIDERDSAIKLALRSPSDNIEPCCEVSNHFEGATTAIKTIKVGKAKAVGSKIEVIRKAIIEYV